MSYIQSKCAPTHPPHEAINANNTQGDNTAEMIRNQKRPLPPHITTQAYITMSPSEPNSQTAGIRSEALQCVRSHINNADKDLQSITSRPNPHPKQRLPIPQTVQPINNQSPSLCLASKLSPIDQGYPHPQPRQQSNRSSPAMPKQAIIRNRPHKTKKREKMTRKLSKQMTFSIPVQKQPSTDLFPIQSPTDAIRSLTGSRLAAGSV